MSGSLKSGLLGEGTLHLCVDMQEMFAQSTPWHTPWMKRVIPKVAAIAEAHASATIFTRFIPPAEPTDLPGAWREYYEQWPQMTRSQIDPHLLELVEPLRSMAPPAVVIDKPFFSPFHATRLAALIKERKAKTLVVTGAETDMCVLAAVLDAVDQGLKVVLPEDALCSSSDDMHEAVLSLYRNRFSVQIETSNTDEVLMRWGASQSSVS